MVIFNYILICMIFGTTFLTIKIGIEAGAPPLFSAGIRFFLAGVILIIVFTLKRKGIIPYLLSKRIIYAGFCLTFMTFATLYWAEQYISSGLAAVLSATGPMMILLLQSKRNKTKLQREQFLALIIALIGVVCISLPGMHQQTHFYMEYRLPCHISRRIILWHRFHPFKRNTVRSAKSIAVSH